MNKEFKSKAYKLSFMKALSSYDLEKVELLHMRKFTSHESALKFRCQQEPRWILNDGFLFHIKGTKCLFYFVVVEIHLKLLMITLYVPYSVLQMRVL